MKAIVKYLPTGKELKKGDILYNPSKNDYWKAGDEEVQTFEAAPSLYQHSYPVKPFVVTQEVKVGDEVIFNDEIELLDNKDIITKIEPREHEYDSITYHFKNYRSFHANPYKVLGEVSSKAIWVKEGDEIEIREHMTEVSDLLSDRKKYFSSGIFKVKCPSCETYH